MTVREFSETITETVPLTAADHEEIHAEMVQHNARREALESKIEDYKGSINAAKKEVDTLNQHIYEGIKRLDSNQKTIRIECRKIIDYETDIVRYVSRDTNEIIRERILMDEEKQIPLDFSEGQEVQMVEENGSPDAHPDDLPDQTKPPSPRRGRPPKEKESVAHA
ncbi:hypothetical protein C4J81_17220 [Deltaproteobacteria bacterium Smac51]|nr:hypothetical protein C4J81_17220 [Deltaproteobacteria bacterium Smac51]